MALSVALSTPGPPAPPPDPQTLNAGENQENQENQKNQEQQTEASHGNYILFGALVIVLMAVAMIVRGRQSQQ